MPDFVVILLADVGSRRAVREITARCILRIELHLDSALAVVEMSVEGCSVQMGIDGSVFAMAQPVVMLAQLAAAANFSVAAVADFARISLPPTAAQADQCSFHSVAPAEVEDG